MSLPPDQGRRTVRVMICGHVQGVGFRAWVEANADALGLDGWVRNRREGSVEAAFGGKPAAVAEMLRRCESGPRSARVQLVDIIEEGLSVPPGFHVAPTA
jgi:acylphosphatase